MKTSTTASHFISPKIITKMKICKLGVFKNLQWCYPDFWFDFIWCFPILKRIKPESKVSAIFKNSKHWKRKKNGAWAETAGRAQQRPKLAHLGAASGADAGTVRRLNRSVDLEIDGCASSSSSLLSLSPRRHGSELELGISHLGAT